MLKIYARDTVDDAKTLAHQYFKGFIIQGDGYDYQFIDINFKHLMVIGNFTYQIPAFKELYNNIRIGRFLNRLSREKSHFFQINWETEQILYYVYFNGNILEETIDRDIQIQIIQILSDYEGWAGFLDKNGDHIIDLKKPSPSPHFSTNLLLGNRIGFSHPLQTTPKSVVDRFGGGSFRSHAATQVLATRWDMLPEENGFPANRQFYLLEDGKQIFYSANVSEHNIKLARCKHSKNYTEIEYRTECGLQIKRRIFILPQYGGLPVATEVQRITIKNNGPLKRILKLVMTGMMGSPVPGAFMEDVVYSTIIMESGIVKNQNGDLLAYIPHYYPEISRRDVRFMSGMFYERGQKVFPEEIGTQVNPETDFDTWESFAQALGKLKGLVVDGKEIMPLIMPGKNDWNVIHNFAPWIWGAGGDFIANDNRTSIINSQEAYEGVKFYSELAINGLMSMPHLEKNSAEVEAIFNAGDAATIFTGAYHINTLRREHPELVENIGTAPFPAGPKGRYVFFGGSCLSVFKSSKNKDAAYRVIEYLMTTDAQVAYQRWCGNLPTVQKAYETNFVSEEPLREAFKEQLQYGKAYPSVAGWGPSETVLQKGLSNVWDNIMGVYGKYDPAKTKEFLDQTANESTMIYSQQ